MKRYIVMHHRRPLKAHKTDNTLKGIQINQSRKQIPLCAFRVIKKCIKVFMMVLEFINVKFNCVESRVR